MSRLWPLQACFFLSMPLCTFIQYESYESCYPWLLTGMAVTKMRFLEKCSHAMTHVQENSICISLPARPCLMPSPSQVQPENKALSRWLLSTRQFNRDWQIAWLARNLTPTRNQKIHWRSVPVRLLSSLKAAWPSCMAAWVALQCLQTRGRGVRSCLSGCPGLVFRWGVPGASKDSRPSAAEQERAPGS